MNFTTGQSVKITPLDENARRLNLPDTAEVIILEENQLIVDFGRPVTQVFSDDYFNGTYENTVFNRNQHSFNLIDSVWYIFGESTGEEYPFQLV